MKAIIYVRVSTVEQAEHGYSLEAQEKECRQFAINKGYEIDRVFIERGESAKTQDRTELQGLIKYATENKKKLSALIIWKYDRLARNLSDQVELVKCFSLLGIRVLSVTENNEETSVGKLMRNIIGSFSQYENDIKSERTISGMKQALQQGRWCWLAPIGYKNSRDALNKPTLIPSDEAPYVTEAFNLAQTGLYKQSEIVERLKVKGFRRLTTGLLNRILRNPICCGLLKTDWLDNYVDGVHKPLITKELFFKVQQILSGKRPDIAPKVRNHADFPLRNFIRCPKCGQKLTGGWSTGRKKVRYAYYHCRTKGCSLNVSKQELETAFYNHLQSLQPKEDMIALFEASVLDVWRTGQEESAKEELRLGKELKELRIKKDRLIEQMLKSVLDDETYKGKASEVEGAILTKQVELNEARIDLTDMESCLNYCKGFLLNLASLWANADLSSRQRLQRLVFPKEVYYEDGAFRTTATSLLFKQLQQIQPTESQMASPWGFEPQSQA